MSKVEQGHALQWNGLLQTCCSKRRPPMRSFNTSTLRRPSFRCSSPTTFKLAAAAGVASFLGKRRSMEGCDLEMMNREDDLSDDCAPLGEKKRRLNVEQVKMLENNFELGNRLEPERKMQLATALGLQPRQVAIWFQNRRARWKTKQLEKDYDLLKKQCEAIKSDNEVLLLQNKKLQAEIMAIRGREISEPINLNKDTEGSCSNRSENNADLSLDMSRAGAIGGSPSRSDFQSVRPPSVAQLLHTSSGSDLHCPKMEHGVQGDGFCNMFCTIEDHPGFWTSWPEQQHFH